MGGRGASSGLGSDKKKFIDSIFDDGKSAPSQPIDPDQFDNLKQAENGIQEKSIEHLVIFNDTSKMAEAAFTGDKHSVGVPDNIELYGKTVTHNHPDSGWGGTLSLADMNLALKKEVASLRAVGKDYEGVYALVKSKRSQPNAFLSHLSKDAYNLKNEISNIYSDSYAKYRDDGYTKEQSCKHARQEAVGYLHKYYKQTAEQYGYTYTRQKKLIAETGNIIHTAPETNTKTG